jgi:cyclomaltodextrinase
MIYNGMEVSDPTESGAPALFGPLKIWWQAGDMRPQFPAFYNFIIPFREHQPALLHGETVWVHNSDEAHVVSYLRRTATEEFLITINLSNLPFRGSVEAATGPWSEVEIPSASRKHAAEPIAAPQVALPFLSLDAFGFRIFHRTFNASAATAPSN